MAYTYSRTRTYYFAPPSNDHPAAHGFGDWKKVAAFADYGYAGPIDRHLSGVALEAPEALYAGDRDITFGKFMIPRTGDNLALVFGPALTFDEVHVAAFSASPIGPWQQIDVPHELHAVIATFVTTGAAA